MKLRISVRDVPTRLATGAFIFHSGREKWSGPLEQAQGVHGMAANAFPVLNAISPTLFLRLLAAGEMTIGGLLMAPVVSNEVAGVALTGFSGALLTMYARVPGLRKPGSVWPTPAGIPVSKDIWMFGIGVGLLVDRLRADRRHV